MIVKENTVGLAPLGKAALAAEETPEPPADAPPPYAAAGPDPASAGPSSQSPTTPSSLASPPPQIPPPVQRTNLISIERHHGGIKASYIIDPTIVIPEALLPPLGLLTFQKRKNLSLVAHHSGVDAEITIPQVEMEQDKKVTMYMKAHHGGVKCRIRRPAPSPAFILEATSHHGGTKIILPRSFCGPVTAKRSHGSVQLSDGISSKQTFFSDVKGENKFFIGDANEYLEKEGKNWQGDEVIVQGKHGNLSFVYEDEYEYQQHMESKSIWSSLFGW